MTGFAQVFCKIANLFTDKKIYVWPASDSKNEIAFCDFVSVQLLR